MPCMGTEDLDEWDISACGVVCGLVATHLPEASQGWMAMSAGAVPSTTLGHCHTGRLTEAGH